MTENNGWSCCGIPAPENGGYDWRKKAAEEAETEAKEQRTGDKESEAG